MQFKLYENKCTYGALNRLSGNFASLPSRRGPYQGKHSALLTYFINELAFDFDDWAFLY